MQNVMKLLNLYPFVRLFSTIVSIKDILYKRWILNFAVSEMGLPALVLFFNNIISKISNSNKKGSFITTILAFFDFRILNIV